MVSPKINIRCLYHQSVYFIITKTFSFQAQQIGMFENPYFHFMNFSNSSSKHLHMFTERSFIATLLLLGMSRPAFSLQLSTCWAFFCYIRPIACRFFNKAETSRIIISSMRIVSSLNAFYALKHFTPMLISNKVSLHINYSSLLTRM